MNVPPLPLDPGGRVPLLTRAAKRVTMDFSLLSVASAGPTADGHEENTPIQVFRLTFCDPSRPPPCPAGDVWLQLYRFL